MRKEIILFLVVFVLAGLVGIPAGAVNIVGYKFYDYNKDGVAGSNSFPLEGWTIQVKYLNMTDVPGAQDVTDADGLYNISGLDPYFDYYVCEVLQQGWENTTPLCNKTGFDLCSGFGENTTYEFYTDQTNLNLYMPNLPDGDSYVLLGWNARIGNAVSNPPGEEEIKIFYPLGQWSGGQSSSGISDGGDVGWVNNIYLPFNATWIPGATLYQNATWTVNGTTVTQTSTHARPNSVPIRDIVIRLHAEKDTGYTVEVNNLALKQGAHTYLLTHSPLTFHYIDPQNEDLYLLVRASDILTSLGGSDIGSGGFSLTGDVRFSWPDGSTPDGNDIKADILVGRYDCPYVNVQPVNFGNHINGSISGYKFDNQENPLGGWNVTAYNETRMELYYDITDVNGYYNISNIPLGFYWLNETPKNGYTQVTLNRTVQINVTTLDLMNQNFTNMAEKFCIDGYKIDNCTGRGLQSWNISVLNDDQVEVANTTTDQNGYYQVCDLLPGDYTVCEELKPGWTNLTALCQPVTIADANISNLNFTNTRLVCISGYKLDTCNGGLSGWQINLTDSTGGLVDTTTTNATGFYQFCGLVPGDYNVSEVLQPGWEASTAPGQITLACDQNVTNQNFTNTKLLCISGYKLDTCNGGLSGWQINLTDSTGSLVDTTTTNATGFYQFCGLIPGDYNVTEVLQPGWEASAAPGPITLACDQNVTNQNFTNTKLLCISGYKRESETGQCLDGWNITVSNQSGQVATVMTNASGYYQVCGLVPGDYTVCEELQQGWMNETPTCVDVVLTCVNATIDFENARAMFCIDGYKIDNCTGRGYPNWNISVLNDDEVEVANTSTDQNGYYQVCGLLPGDYTVCEELKPGWTNLTDPCQPVTIADANISNVNFTNSQLFCIEGRKTIGTSAVGVADWNITVSNQTGLVAKVTTNATGYYQVCGLLPGDYTVCEELQPGWTNMSPICQDVTLPCNNLTVNFANQIETFCIDGYKIDDCTGRGIPSWNISVLNDDEIEVASTSTDENGYYQVCGLLPGDYTVCEELKPGWTTLTDLCQQVTIADANISNVNFTNTRLVCISGYKLDTCNGGLSGWQINLTDNTGGLVDSTTTNATGFYQFCGLVPGDYNVSEVLKPGWIAGTAPGPISLTCDQNVTNQNFTNTKLLCISGYKIQGETGQGLAGWNITVSNRSGQVAKVTTNASGGYLVCNLLPGTYTVCEELQPGWMNVTPICVDVVLTCTNATIDFENDPVVETFCIDGYKIDNCTGRGYPNWNISVLNDDEIEVASTSTDQNGYYQVCGLLPGDYTVCEELKPGWTNLTDPCQPVTIADANISNVNFTNSQLFCIEGRKTIGTSAVGVADWNITVSNQTGLVAKVTTNATGYYQVCGLLPGDYTVCEELQPGWTNMSPICQDVTLPCNNLTVNFANQIETFCIDGYKIDDCTGRGIPSWNISVLNDDEIEVASTSTDENGYYQVCGLLPGDYTVCEELKPGWTNLTDLCQPVTIADANLSNVNFTNTRLVCISGYKLDTCNGGLSGWQINLTDSTGGLVDTTTTNATGFYQFCGLIPGDYNVSEVLKPGWIAGTAPGPIYLTCDQNVTNQNFTNTKLLCIEGRKTIDTSAVGVVDWNITVSNQSGQVAQVMTNATGYYQVCGLVPGDYTVCEELQPGWTNLSPICQNVTLACNNLTVNFANERETFCIDGYKIDNCTGRGIPSWNISVQNIDKVEVASTTTDQNGHYQVCGLLPGNYTVCEVLKPGWTNLTARCQPVTIAGANITNVNFTNTRLVCIEGQKINATTGQGLANWNITVSNQSGQVAKVTTNATGYYRVCGLVPGNYIVCEELLPGWMNATPSCVYVTLNCSNTSVTFANFPIVENGSISGYKINQSCGCIIPGWTIRLYNATTGGLVSITKTDATGKYSFSGLPFGSYWVNESPQEAWAAVSPPHVQVNLSMQNPYAVNINFTNFRSFTCNSSDVIIVDGVEKHLICIYDP
jgi:uncharacterized surface anchored protein